LRNGVARRGRSPEGADGSDAQRGPTRRRGFGGGKIGEVDAWVMGMGVRRSGLDRRDERRAG
jgi:hypothetical protein